MQRLAIIQRILRRELLQINIDIHLQIAGVGAAAISQVKTVARAAGQYAAGAATADKTRRIEGLHVDERGNKEARVRIHTAIGGQLAQAVAGVAAQLAQLLR